VEARSQRARPKSKAVGRATGSFDPPGRLIQDPDQVLALEPLQSLGLCARRIDRGRGIGAM
jgi:hypothetical protein